MTKIVSTSIGATSRRVLLAAGVFSAVMLVGPTPARAADGLEQQHLVEKAKMTLEAFAADPNVSGPVRDLKADAKALFIVPQFVRGAFVFGGAGGSGVLIVRDPTSKKWSEPAFYTMGSASFGLQIGGDVSEMIFVVRSQKGLEKFYLNDIKLGGDVSVAMGPVGGGTSVKGITADLIAYARKKGAFAGISVDGSMIAVSDDSNHAYYGTSVRPTDIIVKQSVRNPQSTEMRTAADRLMK